MSYNQVNTTVVHDGVTLYQRNDHKVARWYYRLKFPDTSRHYIKSSGTIDFQKAKTVAITQYYMLLGKIDANVSIFSKPFSYVAEEFLKHEEFRAGLKEGISLGRLKFQRSVTRRWFMKYFENTKIDAIKTEHINEFWRWRLEYAKSASSRRSKFRSRSRSRAGTILRRTNGKKSAPAYTTDGLRTLRQRKYASSTFQVDSGGG